MKKTTEIQIIKDLMKITEKHGDEAMFEIVAHFYSVIHERELEIEKLQKELAEAKLEITASSLTMYLQQTILEALAEEI